MKHPYLIVLYAIILHWVWCAALLTDSAAGNATAVHVLLDVVSPTVAAGIYFAVGACALLGFFCKKIATPYYLLPQQAVMMISAGGVIHAMWIGQFADGVQRSQAFLVADQAPAVIGALLHTAAIAFFLTET